MWRCLPLLVLLAACDRAEEPVPAEESEDACGASGYQGLVGSPLAAVTLPADLNARIIPPDGIVTLDYAPRRMNIVLDAGGVITEVYCG